MLFTVDDQRVSGVVPALKACHCRSAFGEQVDDLALALIAPLRTNDYDETTHVSTLYDLTTNNSPSPASTLMRPAMRSSRSPIFASCSNARRVPPGFANGNRPSSTSKMATAASKSAQAKFTQAPNESC